MIDVLDILAEVAIHDPLLFYILALSATLTTAISKSDIEAKMTELQADYDSQEYARNRAAAYPSLQEFAEAYCEKEIGADTTKWDEYVVKYNKVRTDNPK